MNQRKILILLLMIFSLPSWGRELIFFPADHPLIHYTGRIDFTNPKLPRFWQPGVYIEINFAGSECEVILNDEMLWGKNHNYIEIVVDGYPVRVQTKSKTDTIKVATGLSPGKHTVLICKDTEANIGYLELVGFRCEQLLKPNSRPARKIEFIGNSITCGTGSDMSDIPCGKGVWQDQHNAYFSYGAVTARTLDAEYHLSAVSGIGLIRSCCNMNILMPTIFDKISMRNDTIVWDFKNYEPDLVTVCLGQNDGIRDSAKFCSSYVSFLKTLRGYYPKATFVMLSSPMANDKLREFMKSMIASVENRMHEEGETKVYSYIFNKQYSSGCNYHPSLEEHKMIAGELSAFLKQVMHW